MAFCYSFTSPVRLSVKQSTSGAHCVRQVISTVLFPEVQQDKVS